MGPSAEAKVLFEVIVTRREGVTIQGGICQSGINPTTHQISSPLRPRRLFISRFTELRCDLQTRHVVYLIRKHVEPVVVRFSLLSSFVYFGL